MKKVLIFLILAAAGYGAYVFLLRPPEKKACARIAELCGIEQKGGNSEQCNQMFETLKKANADKAGEVAKCMADAKSCGEVAGCTAGAAVTVGADLAKEFLKGLQKTMK
jgi:hypothetical protein